MKILTPLIEMFILSALPITEIVVSALEMADDPYQTVAAGSLKLKSTLKKKKKRSRKRRLKRGWSGICGKRVGARLSPKSTTLTPKRTVRGEFAEFIVVAVIPRLPNSQ